MIEEIIKKLIAALTALVILLGQTPTEQLILGVSGTTIRDSTTNAAASGTALSVAAPTGTTTGDVVIVVVSVNNTGLSIADNNGSTPFTEDMNDYFPSAGIGYLSIFSRRIQAGDPSTYNFTAGGSARWTVHAITFQNPHASVIYDVNPTGGNFRDNTTTNTGTSVGITTVNADAIHFAIFQGDGTGTTITGTPSGYTVPENSGNQVTAVAYKVIASPGATGAQTFTLSVNEAYLAASFAIRDIGAVSAVPPPIPQVIIIN